MALSVTCKLATANFRWRRLFRNHWVEKWASGRSQTFVRNSRCDPFRESLPDRAVNFNTRNVQKMSISTPFLISFSVSSFSPFSSSSTSHFLLSILFSSLFHAFSLPSSPPFSLFLLLLLLLLSSIPILPVLPPQSAASCPSRVPLCLAAPELSGGCIKVVPTRWRRRRRKAPNLAEPCCQSARPCEGCSSIPSEKDRLRCVGSS